MERIAEELEIDRTNVYKWVQIIEEELGFEVQAHFLSRYEAQVMHDAVLGESVASAFAKLALFAAKQLVE